MYIRLRNFTAPACCTAFRLLTLLGLGTAWAFGTTLKAQATDLIISEYVEGSSNNKYIELYNGTSSPINLVDYQLRLYNNGSAVPSTTNTLTGTLAAGATIVYKNSSATVYLGAATSLSSMAFNGNDAIALYKISTSSFVDIVGNIGCDPGTAWTSGAFSTLDKTLVRNANICSGVTTDPANAPCTFPTLASEWTQYAVDDVSHLGNHTMTCGPTVDFSTATSSALESAGTATITLSISPAAVAGTITLNIDGSSTATYGAGNDYTTSPAASGSTVTLNVPALATSVSFTVNIVNDAISEPNETVSFTITGVSAGLFIGAATNHVFTIIDDDTTPTVDFSTLNITVLESAGTQTFTLNFLPTIHPSGSLTIQVTPGPGAPATYGSDYTTNPSGGGGTITLIFGVNTSSISFTTTVIDDALAEPTETVTFTLVGVPAGFAIGGNNSATLVISDNDSPPTVLFPGDLVVVGVNANEEPCGGGTAEDRVSFFCFKEISYGTELILTDQGYERCNLGKWGNQEGTVLMKRTGPAIPAGQVITFKISNSMGPSNVAAMAPDVQWTCTNINTPTGGGGAAVNMNNGGDQLFFMQGGAWNSGTNLGNNATYSGTILYAFSTNPSFPWSASCSTSPNQRSNLPPGVECFSTAPTLASDYNKYIGPSTAATQRDWIIRLDNLSNWSSYGSCSAYNSSGYNWLTAPILPIIPGAMTPGLWRGAVSTDWFECKNWDDARVPTTVTPVVINSTAIRNCEVGVSPGVNPGGTGVCASVLLNFSTSPVWSLSVKANSTLNISGPLNIQHTAGSGTVLAEVLGNATLSTTAVDITGYTPLALQSMLRANTAGSQVNVSGNLNINTGGMLNLQNAGTGGTLRLGGDFNNAQDETQFMEGSSTVVLNGSGNQSIITAGPFEQFYNLRAAKTGGDILLTKPVTVQNTLDLTQGRIFSTATNLLTMPAGSAVINTSNASFVNGPVKKIGNTPFTFPLGKNGSYRPATTTPAGSLATDAFTAEYFNASPTAPLGATGLYHDASLHHVSDCEHWTINRSTGTPNATVTLSWQAPTSCGVTNLPDMRVGYWTGTLWTDAGGTAITGTNAAGTVSTAGAQSTFLQATNYWTLASLTSANPLPIELLSFTAEPNGKQVDLRWSTASEKDNDHFTVERSADAELFAPLLEVPGAGNSQGVLNYGGVDHAPLQGLSYYRLRQTDHNGTFTLSRMVPVYFRGGLQPLAVLYGNEGLFLLSDFGAGSLLEVTDLTGRVVATGLVAAEGPVRIPLDGLARGVYLLRLTNGVRTESTRFAW